MPYPPACCLRPMMHCGYFPALLSTHCSHAECKIGYYAPCTQHRADGPRKGA